MARGRQSRKNAKKVESNIWANRDGDSLDINFKTNVGAEVLEIADQIEQEEVDGLLVSEYGIYDPVTKEFLPWL